MPEDEKQRLYRLLDEGEIPTRQLAERFQVQISTIARYRKLVKQSIGAAEQHEISRSDSEQRK